jgi:hypothetical protein
VSDARANWFRRGDAEEEDAGDVDGQEEDGEDAEDVYGEEAEDENADFARYFETF